MTFQSNNESGFTLIEMGVVIVIMGLIVGSFFSFYSTNDRQQRYELTQQRLDRISRALSDFASLNGFLPCAAPADPGINPLGQARAACNTPGQRDGIVPFRELGLSQDDVTDGFGNPISYTVTEAARLAQTAPLPDVHPNCRTAIWFPNASPTNVNPVQARFCCQQVQDSDALAVFTDPAMTAAQRASATQDAPGPSPSGFGSVDNQTTATADTLSYFAYVLVSHGPNAEGAYLFNQSSRRAFTAAAGNAERENADIDTDFIDIPRQFAPGTTYFDDMILWRTQQGVLRDLGDNSCARP